MPQIRSFKTTFNAGELSPESQGRTDINQYKNGAKRLKNVRQLVQGGCARRPGGRKLDELDINVEYQMEDFIFDDEQQYVFIFSEGNLDVINKDTDAIEFSSNGHPWTAAMIERLTVTSEGDVTLVMHEDLPTQKITRTGLNTFTVEDYEFEFGDQTPYGKKNCPFFNFADAGVTIDPAATSGSNIAVIASVNYWTVDYEDTYIRHKGRQMYITDYISPTEVRVTIVENLQDHAPTTDWDEEVFGSIHGYFITGIFHDQRLHFMGHKSLPRHTFGSKIGAFFNFDTGTGLDNESMQGTIAESNIGAIRAVSSLRQLQLYCDRGEVMIPSTDAKPLTPANLAYKIQSRYGTSLSHVADFSESTFYLTAFGHFRELEYSELDSGFDSFNLTFLSHHLIKDVKRTDSQLEGFGEPEQYNFNVNRQDGTIAVLLNEKIENISAWSEYVTEGEYYDLRSIGEKTYYIVDRIINGTNRRFLEKFDLDLTLDNAVELSNATPQSVWSGLTDYANTTVSVVSSDGNSYFGDFLVDVAGNLDLGVNEATDIVVGYNYEVEIETLPPEIQIQDGPIFGELRRIIKAVVLFEGTLNAVVEGNRLLLRKTNEDLSLPPTAKSGVKEFYMRGWDRQGTVRIIQDQPLKFTLLALNLTLEF